MAPNDEKPICEMNDTTARSLDVIWATLADVATRWRGNQLCRFPGAPEDRKEFWGQFATQNSEVLPLAAQFIATSNGQGKLAIDAGCGFGPATSILLEKNWTVIAIDYSRPALETLRSRHPQQIASGQLTLVEADISTYTPPQPVDLVVAADLFPYLDLAQFQDTWKKIHDYFIKEQGVLIGSFFRSDVETVPIIHGMKEMGAWLFPDRRMVRALISQTGYNVSTCQFRDQARSQERICIQFIAEKKPSQT